MSSTSIHDVLDEYRQLAQSRRDQGELFERLVVGFLKTAPQYAGLFDDVWLWRDYPGRAGRADTGVDVVARERDSGVLWAVQAKFYDPDREVSKKDVDTFLTASMRPGEFGVRLFVSTTNRWSRHARATVAGLEPPLLKLTVEDLETSGVDWSRFSFARPDELHLGVRKSVRDYQRDAIDACRTGFETHDRGRLIMACGTGKTYTALKLAEEVAATGGRVLFVVPSIALLAQTLREWAGAAERGLRCFAVCSDRTVDRKEKDADDIDMSVSDLAFPSTTDPARLAEVMRHGRRSSDLTVVFSTYQSLPVVAAAQSEHGLESFDLVICDEAHRTTGSTEQGGRRSPFVRVHDGDWLRASRRLYMTATPRIYGSEAKRKQEEGVVELASMDDESVYGPEFYRLSFGRAVARGILTDYKVLVLAVDQTQVPERMRTLINDPELQLKTDQAARLVGVWSALAKRSADPSDFAADPAPMSRVVAFAGTIKKSKAFATQFTAITDRLADEAHPPVCQVEHVDGAMPMMERQERLSWLSEGGQTGECRILSNARVLSEGVDVPALDGVIFLEPRRSMVDIIQSVGRVMRRLSSKQYGYVILPVAVDTTQDPATALDDNKTFEVVWKVLQALRAHDERLDATINKLDLNKRGRDKHIQIIPTDVPDTDRQPTDATGEPDPVTAQEADESGQDQAGRYVQTALEFPDPAGWQDAFYAKVVTRVGNRKYWENWARDVGRIATDQIARITALVDGTDPRLATEFDRFVKGLQDNLNPSITREAAIEMLAQHLITRPVFDALFDGYDFTAHNPVAQVMQGMLDALEGHNLEAETMSLAGFYEDVRQRASDIDNPEGKQRVVKELYEKFFSTAFKKTSDRLGIVYTPIEIVDFILHSVDRLLASEFGSRIADPGVHVLDPFTGTGTFITRLLQSGLIPPDRLPDKYRHEFHANEIVLLAYYVAAVNIEETYQAIQGGQYVPFDGIVLTDTFQMHEADDELDGEGVFATNNQRAIDQKNTPIRVIVGNPPYSVGQTNGNDNNANLHYPTLDRRIESTYAARTAAKNKNSLYDSYIRAIRWATDRIGSKGVIGFVTNGGFIDSNSADGLRKTLQEEFTSIHVINLRGNTRTSGETARKEGGQIFGAGSRATVVIFLLVKNPDHNGPATIHYHDIGDYLSREQKLSRIRDSVDVTGIDWTPIVPDSHGDWINHRHPEFGIWPAIGSKDKNDHTPRFLHTYSAGVKTNRDAWVYNFSRSDLEANVTRMIDFYNQQVDQAQAAKATGQPWQRNNDPAKISWDVPLSNALQRGRMLDPGMGFITNSIYRPFMRENLYFGRLFNNSVHLLPSMFPTPDADNWGIAMPGVGAAMGLCVLAVNAIPDLSEFGGQSNLQFFPRYTFVDRQAREGELDFTAVDERWERVDNVTDEILADYQATFGSKVTKDDVFDYLYGILHSPKYRTRYAEDLRKTLPRIPKVTAFWEYVAAGRRLAHLHRDYEDLDPWPLEIDGLDLLSGPDQLRVTKMRYAGSRGADKTTILVNDWVTIVNLPERAQDYKLGSRSALDWVLERYQVKTDKHSGIVNDPNAWAAEHDQPDYIIDLIGKVTRLSVETLDIIDQLPPLEVVTSDSSHRPLVDLTVDAHVQVSLDSVSTTRTKA